MACFRFEEYRDSINTVNGHTRDSVNGDGCSARSYVLRRGSQKRKCPSFYEKGHFPHAAVASVYAVVSNDDNVRSLVCPMLSCISTSALALHIVVIDSALLRNDDDNLAHMSQCVVVSPYLALISLHHTHVLPTSALCSLFSWKGPLSVQVPSVFSHCTLGFWGRGK